MLIKWKINSSRWLWQSIVGESKNFWSITIPALFESSAERLITLLGASSRKKALQQCHVTSSSSNDFSYLPWKVSLCTRYLVHQTRGVDRNIRHRVSVSLWHMYPAKWSDTFVEVSFRVIESISPRKFLPSNSTVFSAYLLCLEFWQIYWCHIILSPGSWFSVFFEVALGRYWNEPITHLAILAQPPPHWITLQSHCQNKLILFIQKDVN